MAQLKYKAAFAEYEELYEDYGWSTTLIAGDDNDVIAAMASENLKVVFRGDDFDLATTVNAGRLESITFRSADGEVTATIRGLDIDVAEIGAFFSHPPDIQAIVEAALAGNDDVFGSAAGEALYGYAGRDRIRADKGHDEIHGGAGRDRLTGGKGSDHFVFDLGDDRDVVTDFDARGGGKAQDHIVLEQMADVRIVRKGHDTLIRYGDGGEILLEGVDRSDVKMDADIVFAI